MKPLVGWLSRRRGRWLEDTAILREYLWKYRRPMALGLLSLLLVDLLEILPPIFLKRAVDAATGETGPISEARSALMTVALAYLGVTLLQAFGRYGWRMWLVRTSMRAGEDLRGRFARHLFGLSSSFFERKRVGDLMSLSTSDTEAVRMSIGIGLLVFADALFYFLSVPLAMLYLSPKLTLIAFLPLPILPWIVMRNEREIHRRHDEVQQSFAGISAMVQEGLSGARVTKAFAKEDAQVKRLEEAGRRHMRLSLGLARVAVSFGPTLDFAMSLGLVLLLFMGGKLLILQDAALTLGTFVAFQRYIQKMVWPMAALGMAIGYYQRGISSSQRIEGVLDERSDTADISALAPRGRAKGAIELRNLRFRYQGHGADSKEVLAGIDLKVEPGERVAFLGAIGSGKSTLLSLLPRLYPVERGMIHIDGTDVNDWPLEELRQQIGYVGQEVFLFSESVLENVAFGALESVGHTKASRASPDRLAAERAAAAAAVRDDLDRLPAGWATRLGERGVNLSGGQRQRVSIARALLREPPILLLDDALSSVDVQTEARILEGLRARPGRNTELIAAHRISTVRDANRIIVLEHGRILQQGTHSQLIADRTGLYRALYDQQRAREELEAYLESQP